MTTMTDIRESWPNDEPMGIVISRGSSSRKHTEIRGVRLEPGGRRCAGGGRAASRITRSTPDRSISPASNGGAFLFRQSVCGLPSHDVVHDSSNDWEGERRSLLDRRISELGLSISGSLVEKYVDRLYAELDAKGLRFHPPVYLSDQWGCPDGTPLIGVPFYLADQRLERIEEELAGRGGVRRRRDALPAPRGRSRVQLRVPAVRARRLAPHLRRRTRDRIASGIARIRSRASTCATSSAGMRRSIPTRISPRRSRCGSRPGAIGERSTPDGRRWRSSSTSIA